MRTKDLIDLAENSEFISGVYNYCDRWCERCPFTSRCAVYEIDHQFDTPPSDGTDAAFWVQDVSEQTLRMLTDRASVNWEASMTVGRLILREILYRKLN